LLDGKPPASEGGRYTTQLSRIALREMYKP